MHARHSQNTYSFKTQDANPDSIIAYCGHNIVAYGKASVLRANVNIANLDIAAFLTRAALRLNHTQSSCELNCKNVDASITN